MCLFMRIPHLLAMAVLTLQLTACRQAEDPMGGEASGASPEPARITGSITYRERIALSPQTLVEVELRDVSRADAPARVLARQRISGAGQVPLRFGLEYDPDEIDERMSYALSARISQGGQLLFISDTHTPVLTRGAGTQADLVLVRVVKNDSAAADDGAGIPLEGMFRYMADAALFRDCRDNRSYPVAMEGDYLELERAYLNSGIQPGKEFMVRLRGRYLQRPAMEGNRIQIQLIVDDFEKVLPDRSCTPSVNAELQETYWKLVRLAGQEVVTPEGMREAHMVLSSDGNRVRGHAGCNGFFGRFDLTDERLAFSELGSTMMICPESMETEQGFLQALGKASRFEISGLILKLYANGQLLARFEAVYL
jgi:uncharacterized lipoprotein YbaY/heat shock protein HslJ